MAKESDAPQVPLTPRKNNEQPQGSISHHPEFGKPSPLRPTQHQRPKPSSNPFNIPKPNQARPEHHRAPQPQPRPDYPAQSHGFRPPPTSGPGMAATPKRSEPFDPFKPVRPSAYNNNRFSRPVDSGVIEIKRPENVTFGTPRAPKTMFASSPIKQTTAAKNLQKFVDLTNEGGFTPGAISRNNVGFGSMGIDEYVDSEKATENIQSLLQGAFEDEDEKQQSKLKKKSKKNKKRKQKQKENKKKQEASEVDDLATQLGGITVKEPKPEGDEEDDVTEQKHEAVKEPAVTSDDHEINDDDPETKVDKNPNETDEEEDDDEDADEEDDGTVEGLKAKLLPHQRDGVNWMCDKEVGKRKAKGTLPKGGILADDMGLGKTVQAIALLLSNRKPTNARTRKADNSDDDSDSDEEDAENQRPKLPPGVSKSTLVVAPLALIKQWEAEIKEKVEDTHRISVCVYHGNSRAKASDKLEDYDVVITTYGTLTSDHGSADKKNNSKSGLFSNYWYRIILDEAHTIKNRNAKATQAACALDAEYRWCLSGTPMQNNLDELQSLIKFLRIKPYNDLATWKEQIGKPLANGRGGLAIERLQVLLKAFMKRRTKDVLKLNDNLKPDEEDGDQEKEKSSSKFQITKREVIKVSAEFMPGEMNFYKRLEQRTENSLEKMMGNDKLDYTGALVLLLRLRQSCNHPDLVKSDLASDKDVLLQTGAANNQPKQNKKDDLDNVADLFGALSVVAKKCDVCQMELSKEETASGISRCSECETDLEATLGSSKKDHKKHSKEDVVDLTESPSVSCSQAARARRNKRVVVDSDDEDAEGGGETLYSDDSDTDDEGPESPTKNRKSAASSRVRTDETDSEDDIYLNPGDEEEQILPSTKIRHLMKILTRETSDHKFIVFSFFTSMLDKIEPFLQRAGIEFARYDGGMRNDHREASLNKLRNNRATRVLLCSLRAGALGLNLTAASRVVILEPFWNPFVEEQAIDRVHRLNQTVDVKIYKLIVKETVEERILDLQERKRELANITIEGKTAATKLTMNDMMALFGRDAESRYADRQDDSSFKQPSLLSHATEETGVMRARQPGYRDRSGQQEKRPSRPEDSVYGRRW